MGVWASGKSVAGAKYMKWSNTQEAKAIPLGDDLDMGVRRCHSFSPTILA